MLSKINIVLKAVASKTTMPITECILITADNEGIRLTANNLELAIETSDMKNDVVIMEKGIAALEAKMFLDIIRNLTDNTILIQTDDKNVTTVNMKQKLLSLKI